MRSSSLSCWSSNRGSSQWNWARAWLIVFPRLRLWLAASILRRRAAPGFPNGDTNFRFQAKVSGQCTELAGVEHQRRARRHGAQLDLADEDDMVALRIAAAVVALEPGRRALQNRLAGARQFVLDAGPRIAVARGEALGQLGLLGRQHIDHIMRVAAEDGQAVGGVAQAP